MDPRPYQQAAMEALHEHLCTKETNPCVVLPTGAGKTPTMAWVIQHYMQDHPPLRVLVLAHVRELLEQGVDKMRTIWPFAPVGVYSAGLNAKDRHAAITYASIQSIWKKAMEFDPWDLIFVDEAHRIPLAGETMYRSFLADARKCNPRLRIVGWTATPYRLAGGPICHPDHILQEVCYEANVKDLIEQWFLCRLRSKGGDATADVSGVHIRQGEFVAAELDAAVNTKSLVAEAVREILPMVEGRNAVLFFCVNVSHSHNVSDELAKHGVEAPVVTAETPGNERAEIIRRFTAGEYRALCNVNVLSEGFDAQRIDAVVMLRPTASPGLYYQQVGRGLRIHPSKSDCLVLDFAGNIERHGPIDAVEGGKVKLTRCPKCKEIHSAALDACPGCGWYESVECDKCHHLEHADYVRCSRCGNLLKPKFCKACEAPNEPAAEVCFNCNNRFGGEPREIKHEVKASAASILTPSEPWEMTVTDVLAKKHQKAGKPPLLKVTYYGGYEQHTEWVCLEHEGFARTKAAKWWERRFGKPVPKTVDEAMSMNLFLSSAIKEMTHSIRVKQSGKYTDVMSVTLKNEHRAIAR